MIVLQGIQQDALFRYERILSNELFTVRPIVLDIASSWFGASLPYCFTYDA